MKSIKSKILVLIVSAMLLIIITIGLTVVVNVGEVLNTDSNAITKQAAETESNKINNIFFSMEYTVKMLDNFITYSFDDASQLTDPTFRTNYTQDIKEWIINTVGRDTSGVVSYFFRIAPELSDATSGFFVAIRDGGKHFEDIPVTDLTDWQSTGKARWYSEPALAGQPTWVMPYDDGLNHTNVITYATPIYKNGVFLGVIGMEIDFAYITSIVDKITVFDNGFAYITDSSHSIIYSPVSEHKLDQSHSEHGYAEEHRDLNNGMHLIIHVDYVDMQQDAYSLFGSVALLSFLIIIIFIIITINFVNHIIKPLNELAVSAESIVDGKYELQLDENVDEEIFALGTALSKTAEKVANYVNYINALAYRDGLTGVKNVSAYNEMIVDLERRIRSGEKLDFAILVVDINMLKHTNDRFGHEVGNQLIIKVAKLIAATFSASPVFRIGGDEFVIMLENEDLAKAETLIELLDSYCSCEFVNVEEEQVPISIAHGLAFYNPDHHVTYSDIFERADREMYAHKRMVKSQLELQNTELQAVET